MGKWRILEVKSLASSHTVRVGRAQNVNLTPTPEESLSQKVLCGKKNTDKGREKVIWPHNRKQAQRRGQWGKERPCQTQVAI